jgi:hypothetical protein
VAGTYTREVRAMLTLTEEQERVLKDYNEVNPNSLGVLLERCGGIDELLTRINVDGYEFLDRAFRWSSTEEGHRYWASIYTRLTNKARNNL